MIGTKAPLDKLEQLVDKHARTSPCLSKRIETKAIKLQEITPANNAFSMGIAEVKAAALRKRSNGADMRTYERQPRQLLQRVTGGPNAP